MTNNLSHNRPNVGCLGAVRNDTHVFTFVTTPSAKITAITGQHKLSRYINRFILCVTSKPYNKRICTPADFIYNIAYCPKIMRRN